MFTCPNLRVQSPARAGIISGRTNVELAPSHLPSHPPTLLILSVRNVRVRKLWRLSRATRVFYSQIKVCAHPCYLSAHRPLVLSRPRYIPNFRKDPSTYTASDKGVLDTALAKCIEGVNQRETDFRLWIAYLDVDAIRTVGIT